MNTQTTKTESENKTLHIEEIGQKSKVTIPVELSTRFLEHFSEQLYSSPQKAFEELISNSWDAGANCVDVHISSDLTTPEATMCVLDNGMSMDAEGLRNLWRIAVSTKKENPEQFGRQVIGKFGIGKLATYVLANKLTYICKADDGIIRRVTMDYGKLKAEDAADERLINDLQLELFEVTEDEVEEALKPVSEGDKIIKLIRDGFPEEVPDLFDNEYGESKGSLEKKPSGTWTLVVLSDLKNTGRNLKIGILRYMLESALPIGSEMAIRINGNLLKSSKLETPIQTEWRIGPELNISEIEIEDSNVSEVSPQPSLFEETKTAVKVPTGYEGGVTTEATNKVAVKVADNVVVEPVKKGKTKIKITSGNKPEPFVDIPGIGVITGNVRLYKSPISGGKSDERGASNGFHVNVLGRVINQNDPDFGLKNLSHGAWSHFRMSVRADGLNSLLTINREQLQDKEELKVFRAFLKAVFNKARTVYDSDESAIMPDGGDILVKTLGVLSLSPLRNIVSKKLNDESTVGSLFDDSEIDDKAKAQESWRDNTEENIKNALKEVKYESFENDKTFVKFRISDNSIVINKEHPFVEEYSKSKAEKELLRTIAMVDLLTDMYALDIGIEPSVLENIINYRDRLLRFRAMQSRQSGVYIAKLLLETQNESKTYKLLEKAVSDALRYLGFHVDDLAKSGEPEGIAKAFTTPSNREATEKDPNPPLYSFSFDAKSSKHEDAKTGNIKLDGIVEHRERFGADYALIIAPGYQDGAIDVRCEQQKVTPMTARDLGKLLTYTAEYGAIPLDKIQEVFGIHNAAGVSEWVNNLEDWLKESRHLTLDVFLQALELLRGKVPDVLEPGIIALRCRENLGAIKVKNQDVIAVVKGLSVLIPDLVGIDDGTNRIVINASPSHIAAAVRAHLERLR